MLIFNDINIENGMLTDIVIDGMYETTEAIKASLDGIYNSSLNPYIINATHGLIYEYRLNGKLPKKKATYYS